MQNKFIFINCSCGSLKPEGYVSCVTQETLVFLIVFYTISGNLSKKSAHSVTRFFVGGGGGGA